MQVKKKIFPYPVLNHNAGLSNFGNKTFTFSFEQEQNENEFILKGAKFETDSELINELYDAGNIAVYCVVECSDTVYRKKYLLNREGTNIKLSKVDFTEKVDVSMFAVAVKNFLYSSDEFEEDYLGIELEIEKNDIIAANDGFNLTFNHEEEEDSFAHSIFSIITSHDMAPGAYTVECTTGRKIVVTMSDEDFKNYKTIYTVPVFKEVFFNMLLIPALIEGLALCQQYLKEQDNRDLEDACNQFIWFRSIVSSYKKLKGEELVTDDFKKMSAVFLSQELLGKPLGGAMDKMVKEINPTSNEGGEDE